MDNSEFPPNSQASKKVPEDKKIERVTSGEVIRKKKSLRKRFSESIIAGDAKTSTRFVVLDVLIPAMQDMFIEVIQSGVEKWVRGDSRRPYRGGATSLAHPNPYGQINYTRYSSPARTPSSQRALSRAARSRHDFDGIVLESRAEAEEVIDQLFDVVSRYETATVADLYELVGLAPSHTDNKWGWTDIRGAGVSRSRDGYLLDLPDPIPID
jgi:hypothetical protein